MTAVPEDKVVKIEQAALKLFVRHGFQKVRMGEIAVAAGMSRPTLYAQFADKQTILGSIIQRHTREAVARLLPELARLRDPAKRIRLIVERCVVEPHAKVFEEDFAIDLATNAAQFAPDAVDEFWGMVEQLVGAEFAALAPAGGKAAPAVARVLVLAIRGIKEIEIGLDEFRGAVDMTIAMACAYLPGASRARMRSKPSIATGRE